MCRSKAETHNLVGYRQELAYTPGATSTDPKKSGFIFLYAFHQRTHSTAVSVAVDTPVRAPNMRATLFVYPPWRRSLCIGHEVVGVECAETAAWQLQRDAWLKFETSRELPAAGAAVGSRRQEFIPASTFDKKRLGYVFKTDAKGTGYYLDSKAIKVTIYVLIDDLVPHLPL